MRTPALALAAALLLGACAGDSVLTWRGEERFEPLPADAEVRLFVRTSASDDIREALVARGAETVTAFPEGERLAEIAAKNTTFLSWDTVLREVRDAARAVGADQAVATGTAGSSAVFFQLLRSFDLDARRWSPREPVVPAE